MKVLNKTMCVQQKQHSQLAKLVAKARGEKLKDEFIPVEYHPQDIIAAKKVLNRLLTRKSVSTSSENVNCKKVNNINYER